MTRDSAGPMTTRARRAMPTLLVAVLFVGFSLSACSLVKKASNAVHTVERNKSTIDAFTNKVKSGEAVPFEATYVTTGSAPATIVYAVKPPNGLLFNDTPSKTSSSGSSGVSGFEVVVNPSGEYACTPPTSSNSKWTCQKLDPATATTENKIFDFYTPSHWINFLRDFSVAAGLAGDKISSSTMSVNGFNMSCVDLQASGEPGTSTICTTSQGILGYVKVAGDSTTFEIKSFTSSPSGTQFQIPPGAKVTTSNKGVTP